MTRGAGSTEVQVGLVVALTVLAAPLPAAGQQPAQPVLPLQVFLDCQTFGCNRQFIRSELTWVNWVLDREAASVHLLITSQPAGGGGRRFNLEFIGRDAFADEQRQLSYVTAGDATNNEIREGLLEQIGLGLVPFALETPAAGRLSVRYSEPATGTRGAVPTDDPWNLWVFTLGVEGDVEGEETQSAIELEGSVQASRTTDSWRVRSGLEFSRAEDRRELEDRTVTTVRENWSMENFVVRGVASHWALGLRADVGKDTRFNQDLYVYVAPGIEYSVFPYTDFARRAVTFQYLVGGHHFGWTDTTLYGKIAESRLSESLTAAVEFVQPWGEVDMSMTGSHYLHDRRRWRFEVRGRLEVRLFQGFSVNLGGNYQWIRDQLHLPAAQLTDDEILLELQQLATNFSYGTFFGISYRFGSIFSGVVNPRFGGGGGRRGGGGFF